MKQTKKCVLYILSLTLCGVDLLNKIFTDSHFEIGKWKIHEGKAKQLVYKIAYKNIIFRLN